VPANFSPCSCASNPPPAILRLLATAPILIAYDARAADLPVVRWQGRTMGSPYTVQLVGQSLSNSQGEQLQAEVEDRLQEINRQMSHYLPQSELSQFNRAAAGTPFKVSPEFAHVIRFALDLAQRSQGAFDPTLGSVINLWGFGEKTDQGAVPLAADLLAAMRTSGWKNLAISAGDELTKDISALRLNLSAVAKGFGADEIGRLLTARGFTNWYAAIAGEVVVAGHNPRGSLWRVGISAPTENWREGDPMAVAVQLSNQAISTSGDYQKFFLAPDGRRLSHILDPRTGWPVQNDVAGVSVVAPDAMTADGLATTLFVLGPAAGLKFVAAWTNVAALFLIRTPDGRFKQIATPNFPRSQD